MTTIFVPDDFYCPITGELMNDPVSEPAGHTYEKSAITKWLSKNDIPYDELYFGKPWGKDLSYIDDKSLPIEKFLY